MTLDRWLRAHPKARRAIKSWVSSRASGKSKLGSRQIVRKLRAEFDYPFRDHTALQVWARKAFGETYERGAKLARTPKVAPKTYVRTDRDVRKIERYQDFFVTCAVEDSFANPAFLKAVQAWKAETGGIIAINPVNYKNPTSQREEKRNKRERWFDPQLEEYMISNELRPHPDVAIMTTKTQATVHNPLPARLSGRTQHRSAVFGHPQLTMRTVPTPQAHLPKILYASGSITTKNYSDTTSGDMGRFHHTLGGVIVEIRGDRFHMREVTWDGEGFTDLDRRYTERGVSDAPSPQALVMGDIHAPGFYAPNVDKATFGPYGIYEMLAPQRLVLHDLADNRSVNPHEVLNALTQAARTKAGLSSLERELAGVAEFLNNLPEFDEILVVRSNHDDFLDRWLQRARPSPENAKLFHKLSYMMLEHHEEHGDFPIALELALRDMFDLPAELRFLQMDESYRLGAVELGMHGHAGPNGARGSIQNLSYIGTRSMIGHGHGPGIWQGVYMVGMSSVYRQGYNVGPSGWLQSHGLIHHNGYRQLVHIIGEHWRGE